FRFQPVDTGEVAARLAELALGTPAGLVPDMAGPKVYSAAALLRGYLRASHRHRPIIPVWLPGKAARAVRAGANPAPRRALCRRPRQTRRQRTRRMAIGTGTVSSGLRCRRPRGRPPSRSPVSRRADRVWP